jgi:ribosome biogenesis GTPase
LQFPVEGVEALERKAFTGLLRVGDWVCTQQASPELAIIHSVLPRKSFLRRKRPGKIVDFQMIAANIDIAFVVQSCHYDFNIRRLDRYLVACSDGGIEPVIILSKTDLMTPDEVDGQMLDIRCSTLHPLMGSIPNWV